MKSVIVMIGVMVFICCVMEGIPAVKGEVDYYEVLGVSRSATTQEIKKAYRTLSKQWHPDRFPGDEAAHEKYMTINEAHDVLKDEEKRRIYDQQGVEGLKKSRGQQGGGHPFDPFADLFGFGRRQQQQGGDSGLREGPSVAIPFQVSLQDLYLGKEVEVFHRKQVLCRHCRGTGAEHFDGIQKCPVCGGSGRQIIERRHGNMIMQQQAVCSKCGGSGQTIKEACSVCHGSKVSSGDEYLTVLVEKGMPNGHHIVIRGAADQVPDAHPGDVHFILYTLPHPTFAREGNNLRMKLKIPLLEALIGFSKTFKHLDGHEFTVSRSSITTPGYVQKIPGQGMPIFESPSAYGDLLIEYTIVFPRALTEEQKQGFIALLGPR